MSPQDNSDASLLVYADYLLDQGRDEESAWVRESINESPRKWEYEWLAVSVDAVGVDAVGVSGGVGVGGGVGAVIGVGVDAVDAVGVVGVVGAVGAVGVGVVGVGGVVGVVGVGVAE